MENKEINLVAVQVTINALLEKVWRLWTTPEHIMKWNNASDEWHTPKAENDLKPGGKFVYRMEAKDGSVGFNFGGVYDEVEINKRISYSIEDGRKVKIDFSGIRSQTKVEETFEAEATNSVELQKTGWQAILDNFKNYVEGFEMNK